MQINDIVIYGSEGVCRIEDKVLRNFTGVEAEYLCLRPIGRESSAIYVPTGSKKLMGRLRPVLTRAQILALIEAMPTENVLEVEHEEERKELYARALSSGDRRDLIRLIKTVYLRGEAQRANGRKMHARDETALHEAEKLLYSEFAYVLGLRTDEVLPFITRHLNGQED